MNTHHEILDSRPILTDEIIEEIHESLGTQKDNLESGYKIVLNEYYDHDADEGVNLNRCVFTDGNGHYWSYIFTDVSSAALRDNCEYPIAADTREVFPHTITTIVYE